MVLACHSTTPSHILGKNNETRTAGDGVQPHRLYHTSDLCVAKFREQLHRAQILKHDGNEFLPVTNRNDRIEKLPKSCIHKNLADVGQGKMECKHRLSKSYKRETTKLPELVKPPTVGKYTRRIKTIPNFEPATPESPKFVCPQLVNHQMLRDLFIQQRNYLSSVYKQKGLPQISDGYCNKGCLNNVDGISSRKRWKHAANKPRLVWIERLGIWITENEAKSSSYIHLGRSVRLTPKEFPVCCAQHDFFHYSLNWDARQWDPAACPRYLDHHQANHKVLPRNARNFTKRGKFSRKPLTVARDPFTSKEERHLKKPWLKPAAGYFHLSAQLRRLSFCDNVYGYLFRMMEELDNGPSGTLERIYRFYCGLCCNADLQAESRSKETAVALVYPLKDEHENSYQWMVTTATMTDETLFDVPSTTFSVTSQSRASTLFSEKPSSPILVPRKTVVMVDEACDVIRFSPDLFRFDTSSTEELDGDSLEMLPLSPQIKKLETESLGRNFQNADALNRAEAECHESKNVRPEGLEPVEKVLEEKQRVMRAANGGEQSQSSLDSKTHRMSTSRESRNGEGLPCEDIAQVVSAEFDEGGSATESRVALIQSDTESSLKSRGSSPVMPSSKRTLPPPPRLKRPAISITPPKLIAKAEGNMRHEGICSKSSNEIHRKVKLPAVIVPPAFKERGSSSTSRMSSRSPIKIHTPSPSSSRGGRRGKVVKDQTMRNELERLAQAEKRLQKAKMINEKLKQKRSIPSPPIISSSSPDLSGDDSFLMRYCILRSKNLELYKKTFDEVDVDKDGYLSCDEVLDATQVFLTQADAESDLRLVYRVCNNLFYSVGLRHLFTSKFLPLMAKLCIEELDIAFIHASTYQIGPPKEDSTYGMVLELAGHNVTANKIGFKLFSVIVALSQKIALLDDFMKGLLQKNNFRSLDSKMWKAMQLFNIHADTETNTIPVEILWLELQAGGIAEKHEVQVRKTLGHLRSLDVLDFMTYLPLFTLTHSQIIKNPLSNDRSI